MQHDLILIYSGFWFVFRSATSKRPVRVVGIEPTRYFYQQILSLLCLPFHHTRSIKAVCPAVNRLSDLPRTCHLSSVRVERTNRPSLRTSPVCQFQHEDSIKGSFYQYLICSTFLLVLYHRLCDLSRGF